MTLVSWSVPDMMVDISPEDRVKVEAAIAKLTPHIPDEFQGMAGPMMEGTFASVIAAGGADALDQMLIDLETVQVAITLRDSVKITEVGAKYNVPAEYIAVIAGMLGQVEAEEVGDGSLEKLNPDYSDVGAR